jgi:hypothetical protein
MKSILLAILILVSCAVFGNTIDLLKTDQDVEKFIGNQYKLTYPDGYGKNYYVFTIAKPDSVWQDVTCDSTIQNLEFKHWQKLDFNKDGNTDLFAAFYIKNTYGGWGDFTTCAIIDEGNNKFLLREIPGNNNFFCHAAIPATIGGEPVIFYRHHVLKAIEASDKTEGELIDTAAHLYDITKIDTLLYKLGGFIEISKGKPSLKKISSIGFSTGPCFIDCPRFDLNINISGTASYHLNESIEEKEGEFRGTIKIQDLSKLIALLDYIDVDQLENSYDIAATDMQSSRLEIRFSDGSKKIIKDYGMQGTLGLERVYEILDGFRKNQQWKATKLHKVKKRKQI